MSSTYRRWVRLKNRYKPQMRLQTISLAAFICVLDALFHLRFFALEVKQYIDAFDTISGEGWMHAFVFLTLTATAVLLYRVSTRWNSLSAGQMSRRILQESGPDCRTWGDLQMLLFQALRIRLPLTHVELHLTMNSPAELARLGNGQDEAGSETLPGSLIKLPLTQGERNIATLTLFLAKNETLDAGQQNYLQNLLPELTLTVENFQLRQRTEEIANVRSSERQRISRYLHDTLSHNLAYLRLMLDYQAHSPQHAKGSGNLQEVERMLNVANESYEEVRNLLVNLREDAPADLASSLQAEAASLAERAGLEIAFNQSGQARLLSVHTTRQVLLIFREALHNIEKHAHARQVQIKLIWTHKSMSLLIEDDGVGFKPGFSQYSQGHHGLNIMKECAADINAQVMISPALPSGTCLELYLPQEDTEPKSNLVQLDISQIEISEVHRR